MFDSSFARSSWNRSKRKSWRVKIDKGERLCGKTYGWSWAGAGQSVIVLIDGRMITQNLSEPAWADTTQWLQNPALEIYREMLGSAAQFSASGVYWAGKAKRAWLWVRSLKKQDSADQCSWYSSRFPLPTPCCMAWIQGLLLYLRITHLLLHWELLCLPPEHHRDK